MKQLTAILLLSAALPAAAGELTVFRAGFPTLSGWKINTMNKSAGTLSASGADSVRLDYTVPSPGGLVVAEKECTIDVMPDSATVALRGSGNNSCNIRLVDASGETHQYPVSQLSIPGELRTVQIPLDRKHSFWGGDGNGRIDLPVRRVALEVRSFGKYGKCEPSGSAYFREFTISSREGAQRAVASAPAASKLLTAVPVSEIAKAKPIRIDRASCRTLDGAVRDDRDLSATVTAAYDDRYLYLKADVTDDRFNTPFSGHDIWQNDGLEFWFDCRRDSGLHLDGPDDYQVVVTPETPAGKPELRTYRNSRDAHIRADSDLKAHRTADGYAVEVKLPIDGFTGMRNNANAIRFNISLCDNDGDAFRRLVWNGDLQPVNFGILSFGEPPAKTVAELAGERSRALALLRSSGSDSRQNSYRGEPRFLAITPVTAEKVPTYAKFELAVKLEAEYRNPFDPDEVSLSGIFTSPDGTEKRVDGFFYQPYRPYFYSRTGETFTPYGETGWRLRFTPDRPGNWSYRLVLKDRKGRNAVSASGAFEAGAAETPGFLRISQHDPSYLAFDNGESFFGVGFASHFWSANNLVIYLRDALNTLKAFGGNYTSVNFEVFGDGGFSLEHRKPGEYDLANAARFDYVLEAAERRGIYILPCLIQTPFGTANDWKRNPWNAERGGPCKSAKEVFTSPKVRRLLKNRFRYIVARWGYSPNILGWELFNEVNYTEGAQKAPESVLAFHRDLAAFLKSADPNRHMVSTSFGSAETCEMPDIWRTPEIDFTITHSYSNDIAGELQKRLRSKLAYEKPCIGGENGHPWPQADRNYFLDPKGIALHNNLWGSMINKAAGNVLLWWGGRYHDALDLPPKGYPPFVEFIRDVKFDRAGFRPRLLPARSGDAGAGGGRSFTFETKWEPELEYPYRLRPDGIWKTLPEHAVKGKATYIADTDRVIRCEALPGVLGGGAAHAAPLILELASAQATSVRLRLSAVGSTGADLTVTSGDWKKTFRIDDRDGADDPYANELSRELEIPIKSGENRITVSSARGWTVLNSLHIPGFPDPGSADNIRLSLLQGPELVLGWLQNRTSTWYHDSLGEAPETIRNTFFELDGLADGRWLLEWHDTWKGGVIRSEPIDVAGGRAEIRIPGFSRDIAFKLKRR